MAFLNYLILASCCLFSSFSFSQAKFYRVYGGNGYDRGAGILQLKDSGYAICGTTSSLEDAPSQALVSRMDKAGNIIWSKSFGGTESDEANDITKSGKGSYFVSGFSNSGISANFDTYTFFIDTAGLLIWEKRLDFGGWERWNDGAELKDSSLFVVGKSESTSSSAVSHIFARINRMGDTLYTTKHSYFADSDLTGVWSKTDTSVVVCGSIYNNDSLTTKAYLAEIHINGTVIWEKQYGINGEFHLTDVTMRGSEIFACGYHTVGITSAEYNLVTNSVGNMIFGFEITDSYITRNVCLANTTGSGSPGFVVGYQKKNPTFPTFEGGEDQYLGLYDSGLFWYYGEGYSGEGQDQTNEIASTMDGSAVAIGYHTTLGEISNTLFIIKLGSDLSYPSNTVPAVIFSVADLSESAKIDNNIQASPNPFTSFLHISTETPSEISVFSTSGELIQIFKINSSSDLNLDFLSNGLYLMKLENELGSNVIRIQKQ